MIGALLGHTQVCKIARNVGSDSLLVQVGNLIRIFAHHAPSAEGNHGFLGAGRPPRRPLLGQLTWHHRFAPASNRRCTKSESEPNVDPHLTQLIGRSDEVFEAVLLLAGRERVLTAKLVIDAKDKLVELLELVRTLESENPVGGA